jgi:lipopolysaccharide biosynthesis protein
MIGKLSSQKNKIALLIYVFHIDIYEEILSLVQKLYSIDFDIFLSVNKDIDFKKIEDINTKYSVKVKNISFVDNIGVDILPFLHQILSVDPDEYSLLIKLHTKKSMWGAKNHVNWRAALMQSIIGDNSILKNNIETLDKNNKIGMITNKNLILRNKEFLHSAKIEELCNICNIDYSKHKHKAFPAGSIFIARSLPFVKCFTEPVVNKIKELIISNQEIGTVKDIYRTDGTYCHSVERIFGYLIRHHNMVLKGIKLAKYRILNKEAQKGYFSLVICYNNSCYIEEDLNCSGVFFDINQDHCLIEWKHMPNTGSVFQKYRKINSKTLIKDA